MVISCCSTGIGALFCLVGKSLNLCHPFYLQTACKVYKSIRNGDGASSSDSYVNHTSGPSLKSTSLGHSPKISSDKSETLRVPVLVCGTPGSDPSSVTGFVTDPAGRESAARLGSFDGVYNLSEAVCLGVISPG